MIDHLRGLAQATETLPTSTGLELLLQHLVAACVFSVVGIVVFLGCLVLMEKLTPFSILHEIGEEHNLAVSIVVAAIVLGISIIIAASVIG
ncbi:putative transmembrane protein [Rhodopirellula islandica]|uniref:Transmembrane protein n=1 Tax=Rhodopirellula islandica TaxID=595434 RepID=A0A0J1B9A1_RHOIS|nr:DUF350 domain-containing protein [Rhodopirellula islandica]KLU03108.1 putative transmembrane protein [Rhodopirellula islandica]